MPYNASPSRYETMQFRRCGQSGLKLPALSLGLWHSFGHVSPLESQRALLQKAFKNIRSGDILLAHLGIWSRKDPWAPAVLEPLIVGLKERGFCFRTLREHPRYAVRQAGKS